MNGLGQEPFASNRPRLSMGCIVAAALLSCSLGSDDKREWMMADYDVAVVMSGAVFGRIAGASAAGA